MPSNESVQPSAPTLASRAATSRNVLKVLLILAVLYTLYFAKTLMLPLMIAAILALFCNPLVTALRRQFIPKVIAAILVMVILTSSLALAVSLLAQPAEKWIAAIPYAAEEIALQLDQVANSNGFAQPAATADAAVNENEESISEHLRNRFFTTVVNFSLNSTPILLAQILAVIILVYFFLVYGEGLLRKMIRLCPAMVHKRATIIIVRTIQTDVSYYILVVSVINTCLGIATGLALWALGVRDPALWGALAALLNFAPYLGPFVMTIILSFVGLIQFGITGYALLVPLAYLTVNFIECQFATPTALGNRLRLNPLVVFLWLILWGWMWGGAGMLIGVPLLVCVKIIATQLHSFDPWIQLIER